LESLIKIKSEKYNYIKDEIIETIKEITEIYDLIKNLNSQYLLVENNIKEQLSNFYLVIRDYQLKIKDKINKISKKIEDTIYISSDEFINNFNELNFEFYCDKNTFHNRHKDQYLPNPTSFVLEKDFNYNNELLIYNLNTKLKNIDEYNLKLIDTDNFQLNISDDNSSYKTSLDLSDDLELEKEKEMDNENDNNEVYGDIEENIEDYEYVVKENKNENIVVSFVKKIKGIFW
jgi:hypothetical protein